jgi:hypothetical protein
MTTTTNDLALPSRPRRSAIKDIDNEIARLKEQVNSLTTIATKGRQSTARIEENEHIKLLTA